MFDFRIRPAGDAALRVELAGSARRRADSCKDLDVVAAALKNDRLAEYGFNVEGHADPRGDAGVFSDGSLDLTGGGTALGRREMVAVLRVAGTEVGVPAAPAEPPKAALTEPRRLFRCLAFSSRFAPASSIRPSVLSRLSRLR